MLVATRAIEQDGEQMHRNMGTADRWIRALVLAPVFVVLGIVVGASSLLGIVLFALAVVMLATAVVGWCPLYAPFHLDTHRRHGGALPS